MTVVIFDQDAHEIGCLRTHHRLAQSRSVHQHDAYTLSGEMLYVYSAKDRGPRLAVMQSAFFRRRCQDFGTSSQHNGLTDRPQEAV